MPPPVHQGPHPGPLGWIDPAQRTPAQQAAHAQALAKRVNFGLAPMAIPVGQKIMLTDSWKHPLIVKDLGEEFTGYHQLTGSCLPAGAPVRMADGSEKPIEAVKKGDEVLTHTGQTRRVVTTMSRAYTGDLITVRVVGFPFPLTLTADHPVAIWDGLAISWKPAGRVEVGEQMLIGWPLKAKAPPALDVAELLGPRALILDDLMEGRPVPVSNPGMAQWIVKRSGIDWRGKVKVIRGRSEKAVLRDVPLSPSLARFIGLYLAEGGSDSTSGTSKVVFTFAADEEALCGEVLALARGLFGVEGETFLSNERKTSRKVVFGNVTLVTLLKALIPGDLYSKRVPGVFFQADEETKVALLLGWLHGDGHTTLKGKRGIEARIQGVTASAGLARDMITLALSCGMKASGYKRKPRGRSRSAYDVYLGGPKARALYPELVAARAALGVQKRSGLDASQTRFGYARAIKAISASAVEALPVYDFEVEEDHSFLACGLAVHNCVGASAGNAVNTLNFVQRLLTKDPTQCFISWWLFPYGRTRYNEGDRGPGEGAVDSVMGETLAKEGCFGIKEKDGLPTFAKDDGWYLTSSTEMQWSDGAASVVTACKDIAVKHPVKAVATLNSVQEIATANANGYPVLDGCALYVGNGSVRGSGDKAYVGGRFDGRGGHSTCFLGVWNHPDDGMLYLYSNQWPTKTYPKDPAGAGRCCCWLKEADANVLFQQGGDRGETMALSHLEYFPAQPDVPEVLSWYM